MTHVCALILSALILNPPAPANHFRENDDETTRSASQQDGLPNPDQIALTAVALTSPNGNEVRLADFATGRYLVVVFLGTECPIAKLSIPKLNALQGDYARDELVVVAVNPNRQDTLEEVAAFAKRSHAEFPILKDPGNRLADQLGATRTPEAFLLDADGTVRYRGQIDDQYGVGFARAAARSEFLRDALNAVLRGERVEVAVTDAVGCLIGRASEAATDSPITYSDPVAGILNRHCVECHREGQIAPFSVTDYEDAAGWADMIAEVVREGRMPPWNADPGVGGLGNARGLSEQEKADLYAWADAGAPLGDTSAVPELPTFVEGWRTPREPDEVFAMSNRPFVVPAEGIVEYHYVIVDPKFEEDRWVTAAEVVPGNPGVVHHAIVFYRDPQVGDADHLGWIAAYVPGFQPEGLGPGLARRIPAGARLIFQIHYTPNGRPAEDITRIGLCLIPEDEVEREVITIAAINRDFVIPPGVADFPVTAHIDGFPEGSHLLAAAPHMHLRGKSFELLMRENNREPGSRILSVPQYDFNWQHLYRFETPIPLTPSTTFECVTRFDNSERNLANPDPSASVRWGDYTHQEMAMTFFDVALPPGQSSASLQLRRNREQVDRNKQALQVATRFVSRFDRNNDGNVSRNEVPEAFSAFAFRQFDVDRDGLITEAEIFSTKLREGE